jgi:predicted N-acyltransferase
LGRGYRPVPTWSAHHIADPRLRQAVADYLDAERPAVLREIASLEEMTPFRKAGADA